LTRRGEGYPGELPALIMRRPGASVPSQHV